MQNVADWLENLGMSEYAQRFAENRIDFSVLPDLTDQDLKDLGVVLGDRRKMLRAIAKLDATSEAVTLMPKPASALSDCGGATRTGRGRDQRTPPCHGDVVRSGRFYPSSGETRP